MVPKKRNTQLPSRRIETAIEEALKKTPSVRILGLSRQQIRDALDATQRHVENAIKTALADAAARAEQTIKHALADAAARAEQTIKHALADAAARAEQTIKHALADSVEKTPKRLRDRLKKTGTVEEEMLRLARRRDPRS